ncbi:MAG: c(7)-type cytochrome triheme domain-containing protein, partial [Nitrospirota bacterium]
ATDDYTQCGRCHTGTQLSGPAPVVAGPAGGITLGSGDNIAVFKHDKHDGIECINCHTALFPMKKTATITTMDDINAKKSCGSCHDGKKAFDASNCGKCHPKM